MRDFGIDLILDATSKALSLGYSAIQVIISGEEYKDRELNWEAEQEFLEQVANGQSSLACNFDPDVINNYDKQHNFSRYSRGIVLSLNIEFLQKGYKRKGIRILDKDIVRAMEIVTKREIDKIYKEKTRKNEVGKWISGYDVENGSPSR